MTVGQWYGENVVCVGSVNLTEFRENEGIFLEIRTKYALKHLKMLVQGYA